MLPNIKKSLNLMKYIRIILIWITISIVLGFILNYSFKINENGFFAIILGIGFIIGLVKSFLIYFASSRKSSIFAQARKMFNGKINLKGETELSIKGWKIILDYTLEHIGNGAFEYVIAKIDLSNTLNDIMAKTKAKFDIVELNNKTYAVVYCSWGYKGDEFKERIENILVQIEKTLNK